MILSFLFQLQLVPFSLFSLYSHHTELHSLAQTQQNHSCLRTFAQAFLSAWHAVVRDLHMAGSFHHIFHLRGVLSLEVSALITSVGTLTYYFVLFSSYYLSLIKILFVYLGVFVCP